MQLFQVAVTKSRIEITDIESIIYEEEKVKEEVNNDNNDFSNINEEVFIEEDIAAVVDTNLDSNSDSDSDNDDSQRLINHLCSRSIFFMLMTRF